MDEKRTVKQSHIDEAYLKLIGLGGKEYVQYEPDCEICDRHDFERILNKGKIGKRGEYGPVNIVSCRHCGHVMLNPRFEPQFYIDYYREIYHEVGGFGGGEPKPGALEGEIARGQSVYEYVTETHHLPAGAMLDLGCSFGGAMIPFRDHGWQVFGMDPEKASTEYAKNKLGLDVVYAFAEELPYDGAKFDLVLSLGTLEHVHDFDATMTELRRVLKSDGILFVRMRSNRPFGLAWEYFNKNHNRFFSEATHRLALLRYGFEVLEFSTQPLEGKAGRKFAMPGREYLIAKKRDDWQPSLERVEQAIAGGLKDSPEALRVYLNDHHQEFIRRGKDLMQLVERCDGNLEEVFREIEKGAITYTLMDGDPIQAVERAIFEAKTVLANPELNYLENTESKQNLNLRGKIDDNASDA